jgi:acetyl esterase
MKTANFLHTLGWVVLIFISASLGQAQSKPPPIPQPTYANVAYGDHTQQVFDFWKANVDGPAPLVIYIHGGGFTGGSHDRVNASNIKRLADAGIHHASVEYRFLKHAKLPAAHEDVVRAIQFIRSKAEEWGIDKTRIGAYGGSAGAQLVAYLAWHDDMADPKSEDPLARESTRLAAVAPLNAQSHRTLDWWIENIPGYDKYHNPPDFYTDLRGVAQQALFEELSIINHITADDPPVFLSYRMKPDDQIPEENAQGWSVHHVNFGIAMEDKLLRAGVEVTLRYPGPQTRFENEIEFFIHHLSNPEE